MTTPKTIRHRGDIYALIRWYACRSKQPFSPRVFEPAMTRAAALRNCEALCARGELRLVRKMTKGRYGQPPLYMGFRRTKRTRWIISLDDGHCEWSWPIAMPVTESQSGVYAAVCRVYGTRPKQGWVRQAAKMRKGKA